MSNIKFGLKPEVNFDTLYVHLANAFDKKYTYYCPSCEQETEVHSNPLYIHECLSCGWAGSIGDCTTKTTKDFVREVIEKYYD